MIVDAHLHCSGREQCDEVLQALDTAGVEIAVLLAPFLTDPYTLADHDTLRTAKRTCGPTRARTLRPADRVRRGHPLHLSAADDLEEAVQRLHLRGLKLVPSGWFPYDPARIGYMSGLRHYRSLFSSTAGSLSTAIRAVLPARVLRGGA